MATKISACRFLVTTKSQPLSRVRRLLKALETPYRQAGPACFSFGMAIPNSFTINVTRLNHIPCHANDDIRKFAQENGDSMYHVRCATLSNMQFRNAIQHTHPFVAHDRYLFLHNGNIPRLNNDPKKTDSEEFFDQWLRSMTALDKSTSPSLQSLMKNYEMDDILLNVVMLDVETGELVAYSHPDESGDLPPIFFDEGLGILTNFRAFKKQRPLPPGHILLRPNFRQSYVTLPLNS